MNQFSIQGPGQGPGDIQGPGQGPGDLGPPPPPFGAPPEQRRSGGQGWIVLTAIVLLILIGGGTIRELYSDWLWFESVRHTEVFLVSLSTRVWLFAGGAAIFFLFFIINIAIARAIAPRTALTANPSEELLLAQRMANVIILGAGVLLALLFGSLASGEWTHVLAYLNQTLFGITDPVFNEDVSFYVFTLPVVRFAQLWATGVFAVALLGVVITYGFSLSLRSGTSLDQALGSRGGALKVHATLLGICIFLLIAYGFWLNRFDLMFNQEGVVFGPGFTDLNARLPVFTIQAVLAVVGAVLLAINIFMSGVRLPALAVAGWVIIGAGGGVYAEFVQRFQVEPNELARERQYIDYNIKFTRTAFGLDRIEEVPYPAQDKPTAEQIVANPETVNNIRLWDHEPLKATYEQIQAIRRYYEFHDVDIDRYTIDGRYRQVMLSAREIAPDKLTLAGEDPTWVNQRLKFTHGYGLTLSPVNEISPEGLPNLFVKNLPPVSTPPIPNLAVTQPEIYFGEKTTDWVIVNTEEPELDYASETEIKYTHYQGTGGIQLDSLFKRSIFAWQMTDPNIVLTALKPESQILYYRSVQERVQHIAPFLILDGDPYVVVHNGRLLYVQDAYTASDRYPYSELYEGEFNYIRNSVKAVVDAYQGTVEFYISDPSDPIITTYSRIYPSLFKPLDEMPPDLRTHIRYPEDMFNVQANMYQTYHMQDPQVFYNKEDAYTRPLEIYLDTEKPMDAYYVIMKLPKHDDPEFILMLPFTPVNKNNANAWLAGRSDGANYGKLLSFIFPKERLIYGPRQIEARIDQDPLISQQFALWNQSGASVLRGNLLLVPIGESYLYVEPIYLQSRESQLPELARVVVAAGNRIAMEATLEHSLNAVYGQQVMVPPPTRSDTPLLPAGAGPAPTTPSTPSTAPTPTSSSDVAVLAHQAQEQYDRAQELQKQGDWAGYGVAIQQLEQTLNRIVELSN